MTDEHKIRDALLLAARAFAVDDAAFDRCLADAQKLLEPYGHRHPDGLLGPPISRPWSTLFWALHSLEECHRKMLKCGVL